MKNYEFFLRKKNLVHCLKVSNIFVSSNLIFTRLWLCMCCLSHSHILPAKKNICKVNFSMEFSSSFPCARDKLPKKKRFACPLLNFLGRYNFFFFYISKNSLYALIQADIKQLFSFRKKNRYIIHSKSKQRILSKFIFV
jgi:hypothetical protein